VAAATTRKATQSGLARPAALAFKTIALSILVSLAASPALAQRKGGPSARAEARRALLDPCQTQLHNSSVRVQPALQVECLAKTYKQRSETARAVTDQMHQLRKLALQRDIATNPGYGKRTKRILNRQLATDFSRFTRQNGDACDATRNSDLDPHIPDDPDACDPLDPDDPSLLLTPLSLFEIRVPESKHPELLGHGPVHVQDCNSLLHPTPTVQGPSTEAVAVHRPLAPGPCQLPEQWDVPGRFVELAFELRPYPASSLSLEDLQAYVSSNSDFPLADGKFMTVSLSGEDLTQGGSIYADTGTFYAFVMPCFSAPVDLGNPILPPTCLVIKIGADTWYPGPHPWPNWKITINLIDQISASTPALGPQLITIVRHSISYSIVPPEQVKSYWTASIGKSVLHRNCSTCHTMDTPALINEQHGSDVWYNSGGFMVPSALNESQELHHCSNCHEGFEWHQPGFTPAPGMPPFTERRWATPTHEQDINWIEIVQDNPTTWPSEICNRMTSSLDSHELREEHFHGDSRLFWAVAKGELPSGELVGKAPPGDYLQFINEIDEWNDWGAPCPD